jgi:hypothetical protein
VALIISGSGQIKALTRVRPFALAYWTTLRMIRAKVWDEQALLELMVSDALHTLPPPKDGTLHLIPDTTRKEKTGDQQPLAYTTKTGKFEPYLFGHTVLLLIAQWGTFRIPVAVRVLDPKIRGHQNLLVREMLLKFKPPAWCQRVIVEADAGLAAKKRRQLVAALGYFYVFALPRTWKLSAGTHLANLARHLPQHLYRRVASSKPNGERRDYWTFRKRAKLSTLGDVTLVLSKRRLNDPPRKVKLLVTNLLEASTGEILSHFARRWMVEIVFTQMTKAHFFTSRAGRDDVTNLDLAIIDDHTINQQFDQLPALGEVELIQSWLQPLAKVFNACRQCGHIQLFLRLRFQLVELLLQAAVRLLKLLTFPLEFWAVNDL